MTIEEERDRRLAELVYEKWDEIGKSQIIEDCKIGKDTKIMNFVNLYGCEIGDNCFIGPFVEIQKGVRIGNNVRIQSHTFICTGVTIADDCFISHGVMFTNDKKPVVGNKNYIIEQTTVRKGASIGSNATILPVIIGENALVGAGAVVTKDVAPNEIIVGNPASPIGAKSDKETAFEVMDAMLEQQNAKED